MRTVKTLFFVGATIILMSLSSLASCGFADTGATRERFKGDFGEIERSRTFAQGIVLKTIYPCVDEKCDDVDVSKSRQVVTWGNREIEFDNSLFVIDFLALWQDHLFAVIWNNHSNFFVEICDDDRVDVLSELRELDLADTETVAVEFSLDGAYMDVRISTVRPDGDGGGDNSEYVELEVLMAGALEGCR